MWCSILLLLYLERVPPATAWFSRASGKSQIIMEMNETLSKIPMIPIPPSQPRNQHTPSSSIPSAETLPIEIMIITLGSSLYYESRKPNKFEDAKKGMYRLHRATIESYAGMHGYGYRVVDPKEVMSKYGTMRPDRNKSPIMASKSLVMLYYLREMYTYYGQQYKWVLFLDADVLIAQPDDPRGLEDVIRHANHHLSHSHSVSQTPLSPAYIDGHTSGSEVMRHNNNNNNDSDNNNNNREPYLEGLQHDLPAEQRECAFIGELAPATINSGGFFIQISYAGEQILKNWVSFHKSHIERGIMWQDDQGWLQYTYLMQLQTVLRRKIPLDCGISLPNYVYVTPSTVSHNDTLNMVQRHQNESSARESIVQQQQQQQQEDIVTLRPISSRSKQKNFQENSFRNKCFMRNLYLLGILPPSRPLGNMCLLSGTLPRTTTATTTTTTTTTTASIEGTGRLAQIDQKTVRNDRHFLFNVHDFASMGDLVVNGRYMRMIQLPTARNIFPHRRLFSASDGNNDAAWTVENKRRGMSRRTSAATKNHPKGTGKPITATIRTAKTDETGKLTPPRGNNPPTLGNALRAKRRIGAASSSVGSSNVGGQMRKKGLAHAVVPNKKKLIGGSMERRPTISRPSLPISSSTTKTATASAPFAVSDESSPADDKSSMGKVSSNKEGGGVRKGSGDSVSGIKRSRERGSGASAVGEVTIYMDEEDKQRKVGHLGYTQNLVEDEKDYSFWKKFNPFSSEAAFAFGTVFGRTSESTRERLDKELEKSTKSFPGYSKKRSEGAEESGEGRNQQRGLEKSGGKNVPNPTILNEKIHVKKGSLSSRYGLQPSVKEKQRHNDLVGQYTRFIGGIGKPNSNDSAKSVANRNNDKESSRLKKQSTVSGGPSYKESNKSQSVAARDDGSPGEPPSAEFCIVYDPLFYHGKDKSVLASIQSSWRQKYPQNSAFQYGTRRKLCREARKIKSDFADHGLSLNIIENMRAFHRQLSSKRREISRDLELETGAGACTPAQLRSTLLSQHIQAAQSVLYPAPSLYSSSVLSPSNSTQNLAQLGTKQSDLFIDSWVKAQEQVLATLVAKDLSYGGE